MANPIVIFADYGLNNEISLDPGKCNSFLFCVTFWFDFTGGLYKPHWHSSMVVNSFQAANWMNSVSKPSLVHGSSIPPATSFPLPPPQHSPESSYPPTPPKDDYGKIQDADSAFTPTTAANFQYSDYQNHNSNLYKQNSNPSQQSAKNKARARTGTGRCILPLNNLR